MTGRIMKSIKSMRIFPRLTSCPGMNMALDEAVFDSLRAGNSQPYLRFYSWRPWTLSFGYFQKIERLVDVEKVRNHGLGLVRRMSGGKMVFHADELTFSTGFPLQCLRSRNQALSKFLDFFKEIMSPFVDALQTLGLAARFSKISEIAPARDARIHCFASGAGHSVYLDNRKLIGAAGIVKDDCIAVHGSIILSRMEIPADCLKNSNSDSNFFPVAELRKYISDDFIDRLPEIITRQFSSCFELDAESSDFSESESNSASDLCHLKYDNPDWNHPD